MFELQPRSIISEAKRFGGRMQKVIDASKAITFTSAEEVLISNELVPPVPTSRQVDYLNEKPELWKGVWRAFMLSGPPISERRRAVVEKNRQDRLKQFSIDVWHILSSAFTDVVPGHSREFIDSPLLVAEISDQLDKQGVVSICGFGRQGKNSLAHLVAAHRDEAWVRADTQSSVFLHAAQKPESGIVRPMAITALTDSEDINALIKVVNSQNVSPNLELWKLLNEYASARKSRILIVFDGVGLLSDPVYSNDHFRALVKNELAEILSSSNLDLAVIEHIDDGRPVDDELRLLPVGTKRFFVPPSSELQTYKFLNSMTKPKRHNFLPGATKRIHALAGGWLSLAALIGSDVIWESSPGRFIFGPADIDAWEEKFMQNPIQSNLNLHDEILRIFGFWSPLSEVQQSVLKKAAVLKNGLDVNKAANSDIDFLVQLGLIRIDKRNKAHLNNKLAERYFRENRI